MPRRNGVGRRGRAGGRDRRARSRDRGGARAIAVGGGLLLALAGLYLGLLGGGAVPGAARIGGRFALVSGDGRAVTERSFGDRWLLLFFGYTACPDECPLALASVAGAMARLGPLADRVQPLFVTIDPRHDTQAVVRRFVARFSPRLVGLTGTPAEIRAVAARYDVRAEARAPGPGGIVHSAALLLMDPAGRLVAALPADAGPAGIADAVGAAVGPAAGRAAGRVAQPRASSTR